MAGSRNRMEVIGVTLFPPADTTPTVLAIGKFDGVHIGHRRILEVAKEQLGQAALAVMTFWPHPAVVLAGVERFRRALTPFPEKCRCLESEGVQRLYDVHFSPAYAATTADAFVRDHLTRLTLQRIVVGEDFRFGQGGTAGVARLVELCREIGVPVTVVHPVEENGAKVSSSQIRAHIESGRVEAAEVLLGRPYAIHGDVIHGDARGRELGFPTANLQIDDEYVLPASGVYAVSVGLVNAHGHADSHWFGILNAGYRPTVAGKDFRMEVHILDYTGDLYGHSLRIAFLQRVRDELKFPNLGDLQAQIDADVKQVRTVFLRRT